MRKHISGMWMQDGYQDQRGRLAVEVEGEAIYDAELYDTAMVPREEARLRIEGGELVGWGKGRSFAPDAGELDRL
jgi:hypothetical protein